MTRLGFERYATEITTQTDLLRTAIAGADMTRPVPSCPGWNVGQLVRHLGGGQRWLAEIVRTAATEPPDDLSFRDLSAYAHEDPAVLDPWLVESSRGLTEALLAQGPDVAVWMPIPGIAEGGMDFFARRFTHETALHRADATLALGLDYLIAEDVALDSLDEWMELDALPFHFDLDPAKRDVLGPGHTIHLHATDTAPETRAEWFVDLTGDTIAWHRSHEKAAVAVRAPLTDLLLFVYGRRRYESLEVFGDTALLDEWLEHSTFG